MMQILTVYKCIFFMSFHCNSYLTLKGEPNAENSEPHLDNNDEHDEIEEHRVGQQEFLGGNLVDAPETVSTTQKTRVKCNASVFQIPKSYVPYSLQAKKMDMRKLKAAVWQNLTNSAPNAPVDVSIECCSVIICLIFGIFFNRHCRLKQGRAKSSPRHSRKWSGSFRSCYHPRCRKNWAVRWLSLPCCTWPTNRIWCWSSAREIIRISK